MNWPFVNVKWDEILNKEAVDGAGGGTSLSAGTSLLVSPWSCWFTLFLSSNDLPSREEIINFSQLILTRGYVSGVETLTRGHLRQISCCKLTKNAHMMAAH